MGVQSLETVAVINDNVIAVTKPAGINRYHPSGIRRYHHRTGFIGNIQTFMIPGKSLGDIPRRRPNPTPGSRYGSGVGRQSGNRRPRADLDFIRLNSVRNNQSLANCQFKSFVIDKSVVRPIYNSLS